MTTDCIQWSGNVDPSNGYGRRSVGGKWVLAHRGAYEEARGPVPKGLVIDHVCHNESDCIGGDTCPHRRCVNPLHLEAVPQRLNVLRGKTIPAANVAKESCPQGHPYDDHNTYRLGARRHCRPCHRDHQRAYLARKAAQ